MKTTPYFRSLQYRPDRRLIQEDWIARVIANPEYQLMQEDGRMRLWGRIPEMDNKFLRVILLPGGETVHNAFFDRRFKS